MTISYPPVTIPFVVGGNNYTAPIWSAWFQQLEEQLGIRNGSIYLSDNAIKSESGILNINPTTLRINGYKFNPPTSTGTYFTYNGSEYVFDTVSIGEVVGVGRVRPTILTTAPSGWVILNDGSIGSASSSATTRANADTSSLYTLLWNTCSNAVCPVSGGRGASAAADFAANKTLTLFPMKGRIVKVPSVSANVGQTGGGETVVMTKVPDHEHTISAILEVGIGLTPNNWTAAYAENVSGTTTYDRNFNRNPSTDLVGIGNAQNVMQPTVFLNYMIKL